jgi:cell division protein FtsN
LKDYKPRTEHGRSRPHGSTLLGIFIGLALGIGIAVLIAIYMTSAPMPFIGKQEKNRAATSQPDRALAENAKSAETKGAAPERQRFDFYRILPGQEVPVTDRELRAAAKEAPKAGAPSDIYFVQAGAFQSPADADQLKARLALMGLQASIEPANLPDKGTWYRVRLGPYTQLDEINRVRQTLTQNGVDASLVKLKTN